MVVAGGRPRFVLSESGASDGGGAAKKAAEPLAERLGRRTQGGAQQRQADFRRLSLRTLTGLQSALTGRSLVWTPRLPRWRKEFVLVRITRMRGVDLDLFDFDYDLTWMGFFLHADGTVYGRYGGRDADSADSRMSLAGLRYAMQAALARHRRAEAKPPRPPMKPPRTAEQYPARGDFPNAPVSTVIRSTICAARVCKRPANGGASELWVYPLPENIGLTLDNDRGDRVARVAADSLAARLGIRAGDQLLTIDGRTIASFADVQYALHRAGSRDADNRLAARGTDAAKGDGTLPDGWRKTDISCAVVARPGADAVGARRRSIGGGEASSGFE